MADLIFVFLTALFFALTIAYVAGCEHLHSPPSRRG
jgi:hypothetical protein